MSGRALPPAFSISAAAVWMVPGSLGWGSAVLAAMAMLAPSRAARSAIASPMPRLAPVMNRVLPLRFPIHHIASMSGVVASRLSGPRSTITQRFGIGQVVVGEIAGKPHAAIVIGAGPPGHRGPGPAGESGRPGGQPEQPEIGRGRGKRPVAIILEPALERACGSSSAAQPAEPHPDGGGIGVVALRHGLGLAADAPGIGPHRLVSDSASLRVTRSMAWMPLVPS
jgi:hypothetical protein